MCTAIVYSAGGDHYFGRNLDLEYSYDETVTITPRNHPICFRRAKTLHQHYALIGMAYVTDGYPLYYEAINEKGVGMAGLNFPGNAYYKPEEDGCDNITPFEFIPWVLGQCADISEAKELLKRINLVHIAFSDKLPLSPLHWMVCDKDSSIVVEQTVEGLKVYDDPVGVLTNNPTFDYHLFNLNNYMQLSLDPPKNSFSNKLELNTYSRGMGAMGLPGDLSSVSRFVKAAFTKLNSVSGAAELESISQFFKILGSVEQQRGCVRLGESYEYTLYSCCCNLERGVYYFTTYENSQISAVDMFAEDLEGSAPISYELPVKQNIRFLNK